MCRLRQPGKKAVESILFVRLQSPFQELDAGPFKFGPFAGLGLAMLPEFPFALPARLLFLPFLQCRGISVAIGFGIYYLQHTGGAL